ncbi:isochorismatase family protein [Methylocystis sp. B8]|uniref:isochorismatase family protein n=1 Tax=Methylocystis sp. B8 TaxID=544938 RepID=UPI0010FE925F|nr:isochorismatase family protein [Methylocystis sp. B8]TLG75100.1 isochorismatase family protein [Methylocystis sp. B8]
MAIQSLASYAMPSPDSVINKVDWNFAPERAALLIHDMQEYFIGFYGVESPLVNQLISNIRRLRAFFKAHGAPVIYTAQPIEQSDRDRGLLNDMWGPGLNAHPHLRKIIEALSPEADDIVLTKWRYSAFKRSTLAEMMKDMGRDQLAICGVYGHIGCLTTALDAFMHDIKPFMIADAIGDFSLEDHLMTLNYVAGRCGMAIGVEDVLAARSTHSASLTREDLKRQLLSALDVEESEFDADENLIDYGLDSVRVMMLVTEWRKLGIDLSFDELAREPTLNGWWNIIDRRLPAAVSA